MRIGGREIGGRPYVIAEIGVNHDGSVDRAHRLVEAAAEAGADAVKLQLFRAELLMSRACALAAYQRSAGESDALGMLGRLELDVEEMGGLVGRAHGLGVHAIVTVFSLELVEPAEGLAWDAFKLASPDLVNRPLIDALARTGRPLILSTGAATVEEVRMALGWVGRPAALLQCVSSYPALPEDASVGAIAELMRIGAGPVGYSDHTVEEDTGALAVGAGACILEKHLTYHRAAAGPDHAASLDPAAFARYVALARGAGRGTGGSANDPRMGDGRKRVLECEREVRRLSRQSVTTRRALARGELIARDDVTIKRPGTGIEPWRLDEVVGMRAARGVEADVPLMEDDVLEAAA